MNKNFDLTLYLVTDSKAVFEKDLFQSIEEAIQGGVTLVQLREKNISSLDFYNRALKLKEITQKYNVPLIINDRIDIALAIDADGVHLGQEDLPVQIARKILGPNKIIGTSARIIETATQAERDGADYLGVGAMFNTTTKNSTVRVTVDELAEIKKSVTIPVVAIGGINHSNVSELRAGKMNGVAIVSAILSHKNPKEASGSLLSSITELIN